MHDVNDENTFCKVCNKSFSGRVPASQHYASKDHLKKLAIYKQNKALSPQEFLNFCDICNVSLDTSMQLEIHKQSPNHFKNVSRLQQRESMIQNDSLASEHDEEYFFDEQTTRGRCCICDIELTSTAHKHQHLTGSKHLKKKASMDSPAGARGFVTEADLASVEREYDSMECFLCKIRFTSAMHANDHLKGAKHVKVKAKWENIREACPRNATVAVSGGLFPAPSAATVNPVNHSASSSPMSPPTKTPQTQLNDAIETPRSSHPRMNIPANIKSPGSESVGSSIAGVENTFEGSSPDLLRFTSTIGTADYGDQFGSASLNVGDINASSGQTKKKSPIVRTSVHSMNADRPYQDHLDRQTPRVPNSLGSSEDVPKPRPPPGFPDSPNIGDTSVSPRAQLWAELGKESPEKAGPNGIMAERQAAGQQMMSLCGREGEILLPTGSVSTHILDNDQLAGRPKNMAGSPPWTGSNGASRTTVATPPPLASPAQNPMSPRSANKEDPDRPTQAKEPSPTSSPPVVVGSLVSKAACAAMNCTHHCNICDTHSNGEKPYRQHMDSQKHKSKAEKLAASQERAADSDNPFPLFPFHCKVCMVPFNTEKSMEAHLDGAKHMQKVSKLSLPQDLPLPPVNKTASVEDCAERSYDLTTTIPRSYQLELYERAMQNDCVLFVPTGTGKTLISVMVISHLLELNPERPVVFLVDKVLLVLQQAKVFLQELGEKEFQRKNHKEDKIESRRPRIGYVCRGQQETGGLPLAQQDILVITAAYYLNLIQENTMYWQHNSLIVFDEAHHCTKDHPFSRLLRNYHRNLPRSTRPKILGLTASPAGKKNVLDTQCMLETLLDNMGGVMIHTVEDNKAELDSYKTDTKLILKEVTLNHQEETFGKRLQAHLLDCYLKLNEKEPGKLKDFDLHRLFAAHFQRYGDSSLGESLIATEIIDELNDTLLMIKANNVLWDYMVWHMRILCSAISALRELGIPSALDELKQMEDPKCPGNFTNMAHVGIDCGSLRDVMLGSSHENPSLMPIFQQLMEEISTGVDWSRTRDKPMVLVLVRRRADAKQLSELMKESELVQTRQLKVSSMVGHGEGTKDGMRVNQQAKVLKEIKERLYQIVVATSVAEEGVDIPECELVIQLDPPKNVTALVQIRGRARMKNSRFVALCRTAQQMESIRDLLRREENMNEAVSILMKRQKGGAVLVEDDPVLNARFERLAF